MIANVMLQADAQLSILKARELRSRIKELIIPLEDEVINLQSHTSVLEGAKYDNNTRVENILDKIKKVNELRAVDTYLSRAIKEYDRLVNDNTANIRNCLDEVESQYKHEEISDEFVNNPDFDGFINDKKIDEVIRFKEAEAYAAHIGKFIHNFDEVRNKLIETKLIDFKAYGDNLVKFNNKPLYTVEEMQKTQDKLIREHRDHENTVNYYKAEFHKYENDCQMKYEQERARIAKQSLAEIKRISDERRERLEKESAELRKLKVVLPAIYEKTINTLLSE